MENFNLKGIAIFRILNYKKALEFYVAWLDFNIDWEHRFGPNEPVYMQISRNGLIIHLSENKRFQTGVIIFIETNGIEEARMSILNKGHYKVPEISTTPWNTKQFEIEDPFGNLMRFNESV